MKKNMKRAVIGVLAAGMVLIAGAMSVAAAGPGANTGRNQGQNFVDADSDGICDHYSKGNCPQNEMREKDADNDCDGICDNYGTRQGRHFRGRCGR